LRKEKEVTAKTMFSKKKKQWEMERNSKTGGRMVENK